MGKFIIIANVHERRAYHVWQRSSETDQDICPRHLEIVAECPLGGAVEGVKAFEAGHAEWQAWRAKQRARLIEASYYTPPEAIGSGSGSVGSFNWQTSLPAGDDQ